MLLIPFVMCWVGVLLSCMYLAESWSSPVDPWLQVGISKSFRMWRQEDAHEYMRYLIEALHNSCLPPGAAANSTAAQDRSLIHKIFGGRLRSQVSLFVRHTFSFWASEAIAAVGWNWELYQVPTIVFLVIVEWKGPSSAIGVGEGGMFLRIWSRGDGTKLETHQAIISLDDLRKRCCQLFVAMAGEMHTLLNLLQHLWSTFGSKFGNCASRLSDKGLEPIYSCRGLGRWQ